MKYNNMDDFVTGIHDIVIEGIKNSSEAAKGLEIFVNGTCSTNALEVIRDNDDDGFLLNNLREKGYDIKSFKDYVDYKRKNTKHLGELNKLAKIECQTVGEIIFDVVGDKFQHLENLPIEVADMYVSGDWEADLAEEFEDMIGKEITKAMKTEIFNKFMKLGSGKLQDTVIEWLSNNL